MMLPGIFHDGGPVGSSTSSRAVPASLFDSADRYHDGGAVGLKSDEVPAILQTGDYVLPRESWRTGAGSGESAGGSDKNVTQHMTFSIQTRNPDAFRKSQKQVAADMAAAGSKAARDTR